MRRDLDHDDGLRVKRRSGIVNCSSPDRGETEGPTRTILPMRLDPILRRFGVPTCPMYLLGTGVRDASRLIDPNPPTSPGGG
jgi:hypothetical protein